MCVCPLREMVVKLTKRFDQRAGIVVVLGKHTQGIRSAGVLAADFERHGRSARTCLDGVGGSELNEICDPDARLRSDVCEIRAEAFETRVLGVGTLVGEDQRAVAGAVEAVMEGASDGCSGCVCTLAVEEELCGEGGGDFVPDWGAGGGGVLAEDVGDGADEFADRAFGYGYCGACFFCETECVGGARGR